MIVKKVFVLYFLLGRKKLTHFEFFKAFFDGISFIFRYVQLPYSFQLPIYKVSCEYSLCIPSSGEAYRDRQLTTNFEL